MRSWLALPSLLLLAGCAAKPVGLAPPAEVTAEAVGYSSGGENLRAALYRPAGPGPFPALVVVHGDFGPTDWVKNQARRLAGRGYLTLAVDLYRGEAVADLMDAHIMDRGLAEDRVLADLKAAVDYLGGRADAGGAVGILGWDSGGGYALDAACHDARLRAVVTCYGRLTTDPALLAPLNAAVLGIFAGKDEGISPETVARFRTAMTQAGKRLAGPHVYPDCGHNFLDPSSPHAAGAAPAADVADAWDRIDRFLDEELGPPRGAADVKR
jgi:carboxymethylenebutenolidase